MLNYKYKEGSIRQALNIVTLEGLKTMRQVDYTMGYNLRDERTGRIDVRTSIEKRGNWYVVSLWGNDIAEYNGSQLVIDTCGYYTLTTVNRLNGILNAVCSGIIRRKNGKFLFNGEEWDGRRKVINL